MFRRNKSAGPIYQQIKDWVLGEITSGRWPPQYKLQAEEDMARQFKVARGTVRQALHELVNEGWLYRSHGKGTFVSVRTAMEHRLISFPEEMARKGVQYTTQVIHWAVFEPEPQTAALLRLPPGEKIFYIKRVWSVDNEPIMLSENQVSYPLCPGIEKVDFTRRTLLGVLEQDYALPLGWAPRTFEARIADEPRAALLQIPPGTPLQYFEQVVYTRDDTPVEYAQIWLRADKFKLTIVLKR